MMHVAGETVKSSIVDNFRQQTEQKHRLTLATRTRRAVAFASPTANTSIGQAVHAALETGAPASPIDAIDILTHRFPVVYRLVGDESSYPMARRYMFSAPARASIRLDYGGSNAGKVRSMHEAFKSWKGESKRATLR
jgi:hypothetical protein